MPADLPAPARPAPAPAPTPVVTTAVTDTVSRERRKVAAARASAASKSGLVVPPPPLQPGIAAADYAQARPKPPVVVSWEMEAAWPTEALPTQPIKLPRQNKVTQVHPPITLYHHTLPSHAMGTAHAMDCTSPEARVRMKMRRKT